MICGGSSTCLLRCLLRWIYTIQTDPPQRLTPAEIGPGLCRSNLPHAGFDFVRIYGVFALALRQRAVWRAVVFFHGHSGRIRSTAVIAYGGSVCEACCCCFCLGSTAQCWGGAVLSPCDKRQIDNIFRVSSENEGGREFLTLFVAVPMTTMMVIVMVLLYLGKTVETPDAPPLFSRQSSRADPLHTSSLSHPPPPSPPVPPPLPPRSSSPPSPPPLLFLPCYYSLPPHPPSRPWLFRSDRLLISNR